MLHISAFIHSSFSGLQERFLASLEMTIWEKDIPKSLKAGMSSWGLGLRYEKTTRETLIKSDSTIESVFP